MLSETRPHGKHGHVHLGMLIYPVTVVCFSWNLPSAITTACKYMTHAGQNGVECVTTIPLAAATTTSPTIPVDAILNAETGPISLGPRWGRGGTQETAG